MFEVQWVSLSLCSLHASRRRWKPCILNELCTRDLSEDDEDDEDDIAEETERSEEEDNVDGVAIPASFSPCFS